MCLHARETRTTLRIYTDDLSTYAASSFFFFSSRRRHTRCSRDWSSDVCSSDLQNGITTRSAKPGDSVYLQTSFPVTIGNRIVIPVGSYLRGELVESKRPGRVKGRGELDRKSVV